MPLPNYSASDYLQALLALLPSGRAWRKGATSNMSAALASLMPTVQRLSDAATDLIADSFIGTTAHLLTDWQSALGLPDACQPATATQAAQQAQAVARFVGLGGQSVAYFQQYATALGYPGTTITQYRTFHAGSGKVGSQVNAEGLAYSWLVSAPATAVTYFKAGTGTAGQKLQVLVSNVLQCEFDRVKPAYTTAYYSFAPQALTAPVAPPVPAAPTLPGPVTMLSGVLS